MRHRLFSLAAGFGIVFVVALMFVGSVSAENGGVPFEGSYSGTCTVVGVSFPIIHLHCVATGVATHVGNSSEDLVIATNVLSGTDTGTVTVTAANGDQIFSTATGTVRSLGGGVSAVAGSQTVTGGTGRFAGASGSFTVVNGIANSGTGAISYSLDGSISY